MKKFLFIAIILFASFFSSGKVFADNSLGIGYCSVSVPFTYNGHTYTNGIGGHASTGNNHCYWTFWDDTVSIGGQVATPPHAIYDVSHYYTTASGCLYGTYPCTAYDYKLTLNQYTNQDYHAIRLLMNNDGTVYGEYPLGSYSSTIVAKFYDNNIGWVFPNLTTYININPDEIAGSAGTGYLGDFVVDSVYGTPTWYFATGGTNPPVNDCTSWTYSDWSDCGVDNLETRTILTSSPSGCTGGTPEILSQSCVYVAHDETNSFDITNPPTGSPDYKVQLPPYKNTFPLITKMTLSNSNVASHIRYAIKEWMDDTFDSGIQIKIDDLPPELRLLSEGMDENGYMTTEIDLSDIQLNPTFNVHYYTASFYDIDDETHTPWGKIEFTMQGVASSDTVNYPSATPNASPPSQTLLNGGTGGAQDLGFWGNTFRDLFVPSSAFMAMEWDNLNTELQTHFAQYYNFYNTAKNTSAGTYTNRMTGNLSYSGHTVPMTLTPLDNIPDYVPTITTYVAYLSLLFFLIRKIPEFFSA